jgi:hypothetical protein
MAMLFELNDVQLRAIIREELDRPKPVPAVVNTPFGKSDTLGAGLAPVVPVAEPESYYLPDGRWKAVSYLMLAGMTVQEYQKYTNLPVALIHQLAQGKDCDKMWLGPKYLFV